MTNLKNQAHDEILKKGKCKLILGLTNEGENIYTCPSLKESQVILITTLDLRKKYVNDREDINSFYPGWTARTSNLEFNTEYKNQPVEIKGYSN